MLNTRSQRRVTSVTCFRFAVIGSRQSAVAARSPLATAGKQRKTSLFLTQSQAKVHGSVGLETTTAHCSPSPRKASILSGRQSREYTFTSRNTAEGALTLTPCRHRAAAEPTASITGWRRPSDDPMLCVVRVVVNALRQNPAWSFSTNISLSILVSTLCDTHLFACIQWNLSGTIPMERPLCLERPLGEISFLTLDCMQPGTVWKGYLFLTSRVVVPDKFYCIQPLSYIVSRRYPGYVAVYIVPINLQTFFPIRSHTKIETHLSILQWPSQTTGWLLNFYQV